MVCFFRDLFVDEAMKPLDRVVSESNLDYIFNMDDESMLVGCISVFSLFSLDMDVDISLLVKEPLQHPVTSVQKTTCLKH